MDLLTQSDSTQKQGKTPEARRAARREKFPHVGNGLAADVPVEKVGGTASIVQSATQGGYFLEYLTDDGYAHAVPLRAVIAAGCSLPDDKAGARK